MKKILIILTAAVLSFTSCNEWLDVNEDPNAVATAENGLILPAIELNTLNIYGFYGHILGEFFVEHWAIKPGGPQMLALGHWDTTDGTQTAGYTNELYRCTNVFIQNNARIVREQAAASEAWGDYLAATVLRVFNYQMLVDAFGETPYTEALDTKIAAPKYDEGKDIYAALIAELDEALSKVNPFTQVCDNMLFASSNSIDNWIRFANALKLRLLMRESAVVDVKSQLTALVDENNFPASDIFFGKSCFLNQTGKDNPVYGELVRVRGDVNTGRTIEVSAHMALTATMSEVNDARLASIFNPSIAYGTFEGGFIDEQMSKEQTAKYINADTWAEPVLAYNNPIYLITVAETEFLLAEYYATAALGNDNAKAKTHYEAAIDASFATHGITGADNIYGAGKKYAWDAANAMELIGIQKWIAFAGINGFESWCEVRRMGYPAFGSKTGKDIHTEWLAQAAANITANKPNPTPLEADLIAKGLYTTGTIFTPTNVIKLADNTILGRLRYATSSVATNTNIPKQKEPATKVFWAK